MTNQSQKMKMKMNDPLFVRSQVIAFGDGPHLVHRILVSDHDRAVEGEGFGAVLDAQAVAEQHVEVRVLAVGYGVTPTMRGSSP